MAVEIKSPKEIELMRKVCRLAAETLLVVGDKIRAGMTTLDIDRIVHEHTLSPGRASRAAQLQGLPEERLHQRQRHRLPRHPGRDGARRTATS